MLSSQKMMSAPSGGGSDDNFKNVTLLLNGNGTNGAQNNTFVDSSSNNFTITRNGNTTQGSFSPYGSLWSNYFNGTNSYFDSPNVIALGSGNFTVEGWFNPSNTTACAIYDFRGDDTGNAGNDPVIQWSTVSAGKFTVRMNGTYAITTSSTFAVGNWYHVALVRNSGVCTLYVNGVSEGTYSTSTNFTTAYIRVGAYGGDGTFKYTGYCSNLRAVVGTAVYTTAFTPPTTPLTAISGTIFLTCQSNRFIDNSSNNYTLTISGTPSVQRFSPFNPTASYDTATIGGSGYFDGSGDYLTLANNSAWDLGSNNFTVEAWCYPTASGSNVVITRAADGSTYPTFELTIYGGTWRFYSSSSSSAYNVQLNSNVAPKLNEWQHVAVTRNGSTYTIWINGVSANTATSSASLYANSNVVGIGAYPDNTNRFNGYLSDVRLVNGTAVYSSTFTPSTAPLTAVTNTKLLCKMTNAGITDSAMMNDLETVGNAQVSTSVKKFGTGSLYFDGTDSGLTLPSSKNLDLGKSDFTIECWAYFNSIKASRPYSGLSSYYAFAFYMPANGVMSAVSYQTVSNTLNFEITGPTLTTGTWYHLACTRSGNTVRYFVNGTLAGSATYTGTIEYETGGWGVGQGPSNTDIVNGYVDDLRITKGYARYTANFTPPTAALPVK